MLTWTVAQMSWAETMPGTTASAATAAPASERKETIFGRAKEGVVVGMNECWRWAAGVDGDEASRCTYNLICSNSSPTPGSDEIVCLIYPRP